MQEKETRLKIAQISPLFESVPPVAYGGTERIVSYLTEELVRQGHEVTLFASGDSQTSANLVPICETGLRNATKPTAPTALGLVSLESVFSQAEQFDIIHSHVDYLAFPFIRRSFGKGISTMHGRLDIEELQEIYSQYSDLPLVSISHAQRTPMPALNWRQRIFHGLPVDLYRPGVDPQPYLAFVGRVSAEKGIEEAIKTANRAGIPLKIGAKIDPSDKDYYDARIKPLLDKSPGVEFLGEVNQSEKEELMRNAVGLLFPTMCNESFGLVLTEAMACGTPIIASPNGSVPEILEEGVTGTICTTIDQAVAACSRLEQFDRKLIRDTFERRFSAEIMAKNYVRLFKEMICERQDHDLVRARAKRKLIAFDGEFLEKLLPSKIGSGAPASSARGSFALDALNFFLGPVRGGAGTYVAYYFAAMRHFDAASIGTMLGIMSVSLAASQLPCGALIDKFARRQEATALALGILAVAWIAMIFNPSIQMVLVAQLLIGTVCGIFAPVVAALSLGLVGYDQLDRRIGRNAAFANAGSVAVAILIATLTQFFGGSITLWLLAGSATFAAVSVMAIRNSDMNLELLQTRTSIDGATSKLRELLAGVELLVKKPAARVFAVVAALYTFANASMLPLMVQSISRQSVTQTAIELPTALLLTEFVMIPAAYFASRHAWAGRKPLLALSFFALIVRGASFAFVKDPTWLVGLQIFDGISSGIFTVLMTLVLADVTRGTGRLSSSVAALAMLMSLMNAASEYACGVFASSVGFGTAFSLLTSIALLGFGVLLFLMPETGKTTEAVGEVETVLLVP
jgi:glycosyltransferase involved in cell wall biosynthesis/MFS family permease